MTTGKIFLLNDNGKILTPMSETDYVAEKDLQTFLADHPDLLPGDQISPESPRRWLLVSREMGVPGAVDESGRWSLDHLFLDQDGIPTFVECKRSQDTRARREVVAQMLDYAANGIEYWSLDSIRQRAAETAKANGAALDELILDLLNPDTDLTVEAYWQMVEQNLRSGKVRLIFVLDQSSRELRRLVEFLNEKMADVEVLIVEIRQYLGEGQKALVPRVLGITEQSRSSKPGAIPQAKIDKSFVLSACPPDSVPTFEAILAQGGTPPLALSWGVKGFSVRAQNPNTQKFFSFAYGWPEKNRVELYLRDMPGTPEELSTLRKQVLDTAVFAESGQHTLMATVSAQSSDKILQAFSWMVDRVTKA